MHIQGIGKTSGDVSSQSASAGIPQEKIDHDQWNDVSVVLRDLEDDSTQKELRADVDKEEAVSHQNVEKKNPKVYTRTSRTTCQPRLVSLLM